MQEITLNEGKKIYFASDFHFGIPDYVATRRREELVCEWLDSIKEDAQVIFLLGDIFDSWMEYKKVVPKGSIRFLGKIAELSDSGIQIVFFTGNHDLWMHGYFQQELNATVYKEPQTISINGRIFHLAHGDGLYPKERRYRFMKAIIQHPLSQFIYRQLHPDIGLRLADFFSRLGPKHKYQDLKMKSADQEYQLLYANDILKRDRVHYFIFGHRHIPILLEISAESTFVNVGDWITYNTFAVFDGKEVLLSKILN